MSTCRDATQPDENRQANTCFRISGYQILRPTWVQILASSHGRLHTAIPARIVTGLEGIVIIPTNLRVRATSRYAMTFSPEQSYATYLAFKCGMNTCSRLRDAPKRKSSVACVVVEFAFCIPPFPLRFPQAKYPPLPRLP